MGESGNGFTEMPTPDSSGVITWIMGPSHTGVYGIDYTIETSSTLLPGSWSEVPIGEVTINPGSDLSYPLTPGQDELLARLNVKEH